MVLYMVMDLVPLYWCVALPCSIGYTVKCRLLLYVCIDHLKVVTLVEMDVAFGCC